jgi:hypothetical protein
MAAVTHPQKYSGLSFVGVKECGTCYEVIWGCLLA